MSDCAGSELYYIMNPGCGWCTKANPVVEELQKDGTCINTLNVTDPEEGEKAKEIMQKHNIRCGTPLFVNEKTGHNVCGFRGKEILEKWINGEEIPAPPTRPNQPRPGQAPNVPDKASLVDALRLRFEIFKQAEERLIQERRVGARVEYSHDDILEAAEKILKFVEQKG